MNISIRVTDPGDPAAHRSLLNWLMRDSYVRENAQLTVESTEPDAMGPTMDVIELVLNNGFALANLALALAEWRRQADSAAPVAVQVGGMRKELSLADMTDRKIIHRALSGAPDPQRSRCVLIGVSDYAVHRQLPAAEQNLLRLEEVLTDPAIWGVPPERVHKIDYPDSADALVDAIATAAEDAPDALLVYYAGHGLYDAERGLLIALPNASADGREGTVPWNRLAEIIHQAHAARRVVWLDCCYSGLALENREALPDLLGAAKVEGTYMLAATHKNEEARSPDGEECTAFTGELVEALRDGIPPDPRPREFLSLNAIHQKVRSALAAKRRPQPQRHDPGRIGQLPHFHNLAREKQRPPRSGRFKPDWNVPYRRLLYLAGFIIPVLLVLGLWQSGIFSQKNKELGGVGLHAYCSSQRMNVSGDYCFHLIKLGEACNWEYHRTDLKFTLTSGDPRSGICYNAKERHEAGITKMGDYCEYFTGTNDVEATTNNPTYRGQWICQKKIDLDAVCIIQYKKSDLEAREDASGNLKCYE